MHLSINYLSTFSCYPYCHLPRLLTGQYRNLVICGGMNSCNFNKPNCLCGINLRFTLAEISQPIILLGTRNLIVRSEETSRNKTNWYLAQISTYTVWCFRGHCKGNTTGSCKNICHANHNTSPGPFTSHKLWCLIVTSALHTSTTAQGGVSSKDVLLETRIGVVD